MKSWQPSLSLHNQGIRVWILRILGSGTGSEPAHEFHAVNAKRTDSFGDWLRFHRNLGEETVPVPHCPAGTSWKSSLSPFFPSPPQWERVVTRRVTG